jgi:mannan endo-1,4-beta-mannosidase
MRPRVVMLLAFMIAAIAVGFTGERFTLLPSSPSIARASLPPSLDSYLGVFESGSPPGYQPIAEFTRAAGRRPDLVGYYSGWAEPFETSYAQMIHKHGVIPFVQIDPTFASVPGIIAGDYDIYLRTYADAVRNFGHPVVIGFGHEMNASWYSWGYGKLPASTFVAAWQHIVNLFRAQGADNVTWLWTLQADQAGTGPVQSWWPGASYVNWVGIDGYYYRPSDTFAKVFGKTISQVRQFTNKPVLLSETAVGPEAGQALKIPDLFAGMHKYKTLGLVWFDKDQRLDKDETGSILRQDWRIEGDPVAEFAFQLGVRDDLVPTGR